MFTGIVEELGIVKALVIQQESAQLMVAAQKVLTDVRLGDSIAVNGVCLTVVKFSSREFTVDIMPETLRKTNLYRLKAGDVVNLEPALALGDRLGGHMVSGHIDGVAQIKEKRHEGNADVFRFNAPFAVLQYIIPKGSIAVDGISLTVADVRDDTFSVSVIPHTTAATTLGYKKAGDTVNVENDMIGKYVARFVANQQEAKQNEEITMELLKTNGFLQ